MKGDNLRRSVGGNSDRIGRWHKLLEGEAGAKKNSLFLAHQPGKTMWDGKECWSRNQQLLLKKIAGIEPHNFTSKAMYSSD